MAITFGGAQIKRPGAYSVVDTKGMVVVSSGSFRALAFIGTAQSLKLGTDVSKPLVFNTQTTKEAREILGDGDLIRHMDKAWQHGADLIYVSVVTAAVPATPTDAEWQTAVDRLNKTFVDGIVPITTSGALISKVQTHVTTMSGVLNRRERRAFYGHKKGETVSSIETSVTSISTERAVLASPAVYDYAADGSKTLFDSTLLAAAYAGLWAGKEPQDPITYDYVQFAGLENEYEASEIGTLLDAGVAVTEVTRKGFRIVHGKTCTASEDLSEQELSVSTLKDTMSRDLREFLEEKHVGTAGVAGIEKTIYNDAISRITQEYRDRNKWITELVDGSLKVVKTGTSFYVDWEGKPTLPVNNFLISSHFTL